MLEHIDQYGKVEILSCVEKLYGAAERLYALLENLLTWSRIQRGVMEFRPDYVYICDIAKYTFDLFTSKAEEKQILLANAIPDKLAVWADEQMLTTIMRNLISNAIKFTPQGGDRDDFGPCS